MEFIMQAQKEGYTYYNHRTQNYQKPNEIYMQIYHPFYLGTLFPAGDVFHLFLSQFIYGYTIGLQS